MVDAAHITLSMYDDLWWNSCLQDSVLLLVCCFRKCQQSLSPPHQGFTVRPGHICTPQLSLLSSHVQLRSGAVLWHRWSGLGEWGAYIEIRSAPQLVIGTLTAHSVAHFAPCFRGKPVHMHSSWEEPNLPSTLISPSETPISLRVFPPSHRIWELCSPTCGSHCSFPMVSIHTYIHPFTLSPLRGAQVLI